MARVLPFLGGSANGIEDLEVLGGAITVGHCGADPALHLFGLALEHGGLIRHAHLLQMKIGIEPLRGSPLELGKKFVAVAAVANVVADIIGLSQGENDQVVTLAVGTPRA